MDEAVDGFGAGGAHLAAHRLEGALVVEGLADERLEGDLDAQLEVPGLPDLAHPAAAEQRLDTVALAEYLAGGEGRSRFGRRAVQGSVLTAREREVLQLVAEGKTSAEIAEMLGVSIKTIETHRKQIMDKLGIRSIAGLTKYALREGLTNLD